jgi:sister-chromatid-cohesion protein PDS5
LTLCYQIVFKFFVDQLAYFGKDTPDFPYHFYLLENLQSVKTFLLLSEVEGADDIVFPMVAEFFDVASKYVFFYFYFFLKDVYLTG